MKEKQSVIRVMQEGYRKACKKLKRQILDEYCRLTGYNRGLRFTLAELHILTEREHENY